MMRKPLCTDLPLRSASSILAGRTNVSLRHTAKQIRYQHIEASNSHLPRIAQASIWEAIFPRSLRQSAKEAFRPSRRHLTNPASYFIWIYILIGSQAIRILGVQNDSNTYMRKADLKIGKLREIVEKLQKGEEVDVEKLLGTGDEEQEQEWEEALREIENEEKIWQDNKKKREQQNDLIEAERQDARPTSVAAIKADAIPDLPGTLPRRPSAPGFY